MKQLYEDLWQCERYSSGMLNTHAYFLERSEGHVLFYNPGSSSDFDQIDEFGGVKYQLITHRDEVGAPLALIKNRFGAKLGTGVLERPFAERVTPVDLAFEASDTNLENIQVINTPGHTEGSVCFYYESPHGKSYLFSGDTLFQSNGQWSTFVISQFGGTDAALAESLEKLRPFNPDVIMSSGFLGDISHAEITQDEWNKVIDDFVELHSRRGR